MKTVTKLITLCALILSLFVNINTSAATFTFTAIPDEDESQLRTRFEKVALYLEQKLGVKVEIIMLNGMRLLYVAF